MVNHVSAETSFTSLLTEIPEGLLAKAYEIVEEKLKEVSKYVSKWLQFQSLWDLGDTDVYKRLGDDLSEWQKILAELKKSRTTFDNEEKERSFGPIVVNYGQVQSKVGDKYDFWQKEILKNFASKLGDSMGQFYTDIAKAKDDLESYAKESKITGVSVAYVTLVQDLNVKINKWEQEINVFRSGEKTLNRHRYTSNDDRLSIGRIEGAWDGLNQLLKVANSVIKEQRERLQKQLEEEDRLIDANIKEALNEWTEKKPMQGDIKPEVAAKTLSEFEKRFNDLKTKFDANCRAKYALHLDLVSESQLDPVLEELDAFKAVWSSLGGLADY